jgi:hypothetical protein
MRKSGLQTAPSRFRPDKKQRKRSSLHACRNVVVARKRTLFEASSLARRQRKERLTSARTAGLISPSPFNVNPCGGKSGRMQAFEHLHHGLRNILSRRQKQTTAMAG